MTPPLLAVLGGLTVLYILASTLIFAIRHGQLKDIAKDKFSFDRYRKSVFWSETGWGAGFIVIVFTTLVFASRIGHTYAPAAEITYALLIVTMAYVALRIMRVYMVAVQGIEPLMKRFRLYRRSSQPIFSSEERPEPPKKLAYAAETLDQDLHD